MKVYVYEFHLCSFLQWLSGYQQKKFLFLCFLVLFISYCMHIYISLQK
jgi:hypothetical protein